MGWDAGGGGGGVKGLEGGKERNILAGALLFIKGELNRNCTRSPVDKIEYNLDNQAAVFLFCLFFVVVFQFFALLL